MASAKPSAPPVGRGDGGPIADFARGRSAIESARRDIAAAASDASALEAILRVEREARVADDEAALFYLMANATRALVPGRQFFVLRTDGGRHRVAAISSVTSVDPEAPFVQWIEALASRRCPSLPQQALALDAADEPVSASDHAAAYPFSHLLLLPMRTRDATPLGALLVAREQPWLEEDRAIAERLAETYAHAWASLHRRPILPGWKRKPAAIAASALGALLLLALIPTRLTALSGFEIVPDRPFVVAAPSDGTIESLDVQPNSEVVAGQVLYRMVSTPLRDNLAIAERAVAVAEAKWKQDLQGAILDPQAKRDLAIAQAEFDLKRAERDYAADMVAKTIVKAPRAGIAIFNDANELVGHPVSTGQRIMDIADRTHVIARLDVPVDDSVVLAEGARVKLFLDSAPLHAVEATIVRASHGARMTEANLFAYRVDARLAADATVPRIGVRGTGEIYGAQSSLLLYLFRRPLSYLRQHYGI